jgi:hypothetical protein
MPSAIRPLCRRAFDTQKLVDEFSPRLPNPNKKIVYRIACPRNAFHSGEIVFSRWAKMELLLTLDRDDSPTAIETREDYFGYEPSPEGSRTVEWYLNFAHSDLFCAYGGELFAQDEMQVAEHPALASLREALSESDIAPRTVERGQPTPALIMGVERRCRVAIDPDADLGRPFGLYGNNFARASAEAVAFATRAIVPPTITNLIAMEAPDGGSGRYSREEIEFILGTAFIGFAAARLASQESDSSREVVVHTGFWGCGAYGGNRVLMALLQVLAASLARLDRLVFHTGDASGTPALQEANRILWQDVASGNTPQTVSDLVARIEARGFQWGVSDGN